MIKIHKEGHQTLFAILLFLFVIGAIGYFFLPTVLPIYSIIAITFFGFILQFFRNPTRDIFEKSDSIIYAPADGKIVVIEKTHVGEYFDDQRLQVSIFMSPINVHVNRSPISGQVAYTKYNPGKYLVAWNPKSSELNERNTVVITSNKADIMLRQIAGALARRIVSYLDEGDEVVQGDDFGFIRFGSRVDLFLPLNAEILVEVDQSVIGNKTQIAKLR